MDPLAKAYLKVITESSDDLKSKDQKVKGYTPKEGEAFGDDTNAKKLQPKSGPDSKGAETPESPQEAKGNLSVGKETDGKTKKFDKNYAESKNPFDVLFNKILSEEGEMMDFATAENPEDSTFEPSMDSDSEGEGSSEDESEQVTITLDKELAQQLVDVLNAVLSSEDGEEQGEEESGEFEFGESPEGEDEEESSQGGALPFGEAVEAEEVGHALVDQEKLNHGLNAKGSYTVKGAVPVTKKSAQTPATGKGHDGKLKAHSPEGGVSKLTSKGSVDTKLVKVGKTIFDND